MTQAETYDADAIIVGGGLNGPALALALAQGGMRTIVCDAVAPSTHKDPEFDGRAYAVALASRRFWTAIGVWDRVSDHAQPIEDILVSDGRVSEGASPLFLHFDHRQLDEGPFGHMVEDRRLRPTLLDMMAESPLIEHKAPARVEQVAFSTQDAEVVLADGGRLRAPLVIGCDGRRTRVGRAAGIGRVGWPYGQWGLVCAVTHEAPHHGVAHEYFLPAGPFAILPLPGNASSLVWTETEKKAAWIQGLDDAGYLAELRSRFGDFLGEVNLAGGRWTYPLELSLAHDYVRPRAALVGDAAHGIHPIAGQGLNLGVRDVAALAEVLVDAHRRGEDTGALDVLERYQRWRRFDCTSLALATDMLNRLFANDFGPLRLARGLGLAAVNRIGPARRFFMRHAAGLVGEAPRLLQGRPL